MRKIFSIILLILIIFCQPLSGFSETKDSTLEVKTHYGTFPLPVPTLRLPELPELPLVSVTETAYPELPDWNYPRFIPDDPSWLDRSGKFYKEGIVHLFRGDLNVALKRFQTVTDDYPETPWFTPSWFWLGQIMAKQKKYAQAEKLLTLFLDSLEQNKNSNLYVDFQNFSRYSLVWLAFKQKKYEEALGLITKHEAEISIKKIRFQLLYLKYLTYVKLMKSDQIFFVLERMTQQFKYDFEHVVRLAEYYFVENRWQELADLVADKAAKQEFYNDLQMEHFFWLGAVAEMSLKQWSQAKKTLESLEEFGVRNPDQLARAWLRIHLEAGQYDKAWEKWQVINDDLLREQSLRELMHHAAKSENYKFLLKKQPGLKSVAKSWHAWQAEIELIYAYLYLSMGHREKAKQWLQWSFKHSLDTANEQTSLVVIQESIYLRTVINLLSSEHSKAFQGLQLLLEDYSNSERLSDYYFWYGVMMYEIAKRPKDAIMAMRQVDQQGERDDDRWYLLGKVNHDQQKWDSAISAFTNLKKRHPTSEFLEEGLYLQAQSYFEQKKQNSALEILNELRSTFDPLKKPVREIHLRVRILIALQRYEQADDVLQRKIVQYSDFSLIKLRVEVLKHIKDPRRILSLTGIGLGLSTSEDHGFLFFHRANALYDTQKYDEAVTYYNLALKNPPQGSERVISYRILKIQYELARIPEMLKGAEKFLQQNKNDTFSFEILHLLRNYFMERKQKEKAAPYLNQLVVNYKKSVRQEELAPEIRVEQIVLIGELYNELAKYEMAERWLNQALKSMETVQDGRKKWQLHILREKGLSLFEQDKHSQALAANLKVLYLDRSLSEQKSYALNLRIASSYAQLERSNDAMAIYRKMLKKFKSAELQKEVVKLLNSLTQ
jgi:tetratricopeptide (TPR) repeat protein